MTNRNNAENEMPVLFALPRRKDAICLLFYAILLLVTLSTMTISMINHPVLPIQSESLQWSNAWLLAFIVDRYVTVFCLCGIIAYSEQQSPLSAFFWIVSCCIAGGPACCLYVFICLARDGTLRLKRKSYKSTIGNDVSTNIIMSNDTMDTAVSQQKAYYGKQTRSVLS